MKILTCSQCNGKIKINSDNKSAVCEFCGSIYLLDDVEKDSIKPKIEEIRFLNDSGQYKKADKRFKKLLQKYPSDHNVLWQYVLYETSDLESSGIGIIYDGNTLLQVEEYALNAIRLSPEPLQKTRREAWERFVEKYNKRLEVMEKGTERERKENIKKIAHGDYKQLDGFYFGYQALFSEQ